MVGDFHVLMASTTGLLWATWQHGECLECSNVLLRTDRSTSTCYCQVSCCFSSLKGRGQRASAVCHLTTWYTSKKSNQIPTSRCSSEQSISNIKCYPSEVSPSSRVDNFSPGPLAGGSNTPSLKTSKILDRIHRKNHQ